MCVSKGAKRLFVVVAVLVLSFQNVLPASSSTSISLQTHASLTEWTVPTPNSGPWALALGDVIAMSIMAGGYSNLDKAVSYISGLPKLSGVAVGVSSEEQAQDTFAKLRSMAQESTSHQDAVGKRHLQ